MLQRRLDDDQGGPQPKPPGGWKPGDKKPKPGPDDAGDEEEEQKPA